MLIPTNSGSAIFPSPIPHYVHVGSVTFCEHIPCTSPKELYTWLAASKYAFTGTELTMNIAKHPAHHLLNSAFDSIEKLNNTGRAEGPVWQRAMCSSGLRSCMELSITTSKKVDVPELVNWLYEPPIGENSWLLRPRNLRLHELRSQSIEALSLIELIKKVGIEVECFVLPV